MTEIKVGETWRPTWSDTRSFDVTVTDVYEKAVVLDMGKYGPPQEARTREQFLESYKKVQPDIQVGDVLRKDDRLFVVMVNNEGTLWLSDHTNSMSYVYGYDRYGYERTDYKVPVLVEGQSVNTTSDGYLGQRHWDALTIYSVYVRSGRLVYPILDNGRQVELPCPTRKEL